ncbi:hypothetical protein ACWEPN_40070 [Nonomuraea wenchangensis]
MVIPAGQQNALAQHVHHGAVEQRPRPFDRRRARVVVPPLDNALLEVLCGV